MARHMNHHIAPTSVPAKRKVSLVHVRIPAIVAGLVLGNLLLVVSAAPGHPSEGYLGTSLPADFRPFSDDSPWNTPIPSAAELEPNSAAMVQNIENWVVNLGGQPNLLFTYYQWTSPVHVIDSSNAPRIDVGSSSGDGFYWTVDPDDDRVAQGIPMPVDGPWQDPSSDGFMILVDPLRRLAWEYSFAQPLGNGQWESSTINFWDLNGPGWRPPFVNPKWWRVGAIASGMSLLAGLVRIEEVLAGEIDHALLIGCPPTRLKASESAPYRNEVCLPGTSTDGWATGPDTIPEGARLQLDPDLDLNSLGLSEPAKVIARALQTYGGYVGLTSPSFAVYFQNLGPQSSTPWIHQVPGVFDITNLSIDHFRVLRCVPRTKDSAGSTAASVAIPPIPDQIVSGVPLEPVSVRLVNASGQPVFTGREFDIMLSIGMWEGTNPGQGRLLGTTFKRTVGGVAVFDDLIIDRPGEGYRLFALPIDLNYAVSNEFAVQEARATVPAQSFWGTGAMMLLMIGFAGATLVWRNRG